MRILFLTLFMLPIVGAEPARSNGVDDAAVAAFDAYADLASAGAVSPAVPSGNDQQIQWLAPDGRNIQLVVKVPNPAPGAPTVVMTPPPPGADARQSLVNAISQARAQHAGRLLIPKGVYYIKTLDSANYCHLDFNNLDDLTIDGQGSTLVFAQNKHGICIAQSHRLQLTNLNIDYSLHMASLGVMQNQGGTNVLVVDPQYPVTSADQIGHMVEFDRNSRQYVPGGDRFYRPANLTFVGNQTYTSPAFKSVTPGKTFLIFHHYYGGTAIMINDFPRPDQSEDVSFYNINIYGGPGMGITAQGLKRGLGIWNSNIIAKPGALISTEYDGIHILQSGGDTSIIGNHIANEGDDAINLNGPVTPVVGVAGGGRMLTLSTYSKWIRNGDQLAFFDPSNRFLGTANVVGDPTLVANPNYSVVLDRPIQGLTLKGSIVRDMSVIDSRVAIQHNLFENSECHGVLVQVPNVIVSDNVIRHTGENAIRLLTNVGGFVEGFGAINVKVDHNSLNYIGVDGGLNMQWAAISAYGAVTNGTSDVPVNKYLEITNNVIANANQGCITVKSSDYVKLKGNSCVSGSLPSTGNPAFDALLSSGMAAADMHPAIPVAGGVVVDSGSTRHVIARDPN